MLPKYILVGALAFLLVACNLPVTPTPERSPPPVTFVPPETEIPPEQAIDPPLPPVPTATVPEPNPTLAYHFCEPGSAIVSVEFPLARPISPAGRDYVDVAYRYGGTAGGQLEPHTGVEFVNSTGTPVLSAANGTVVRAGDDADGTAGPYRNYYGFLVVIEHQFDFWDEPVYTLYGHLSEVLVEEGDEVEVGEQIGVVGASGIALGSHLHFEVRLGENSFENTANPELWLAPRFTEDDLELGMLAGYVINLEGELVRPGTVEVDYLSPEFDEPEDEPRTFFLEPYASDIMNPDPRWGEIFVAGDVLPGEYMVSTVANGYREQRVEVRPGQLTLVAFCLGQ
ncbi:MAG: hypothetical protein DWQ07_13835 [Chloroflexi bacterium]|nr:MAG: hypothetical protein DWQ07_13835 [Chloroflexota bacterium]MBL1194909.1 hypothetical protein [Chloroflexota bacterium]NOH12200.1 peptidoglycan DD-metalloendopeptidase family protein [Chloroflexota bacterium]